MRKLFYSGDVNCKYGGFFYCLTNWQYDYADALRIQPCSDAGGPDNLFWLERLTVNIPKDDAKRNAALDCCGSRAEYDKLTEAQKRHALIDACIAYGYYDVDSTSVIQVGATMEKPRPEFGPITVDVMLRGNASLYLYARRQALEHCL
jgi:hypothetical protein